MWADKGGQRQADWLLVCQKWKQSTFKGEQCKCSGSSIFTQDWLIFCVLQKYLCAYIYIYAESISIECLHPYLKPPQEELHYSQLTTVKYPCSCNSQIPLRQRQSITHPYPPPLSTARLHKHILCNVEFSQICPVKPQALQTASTPRCVWRPQSVYRCISTCVTCFFLMSSFSSIQCQLLFSVPRLPILSASHRSLPPHILLSSSFFFWSSSVSLDELCELWDIHFTPQSLPFSECFCDAVPVCLLAWRM